MDPNNGQGSIDPADVDGKPIKNLTAKVVPFANEQPTCTLRFTMSRPSTKWQLYHEDQAGYVSAFASHPLGGNETGVVFDRPRELDGETLVVIGYKLPSDEEVRLVAIDRDGKRHVGVDEGGGGIWGFRQLAIHFDGLKPADIASWNVETRTRVTETVEFRNVSLNAGTTTAVEVFGPKKAARP